MLFVEQINLLQISLGMDRQTDRTTTIPSLCMHRCEGYKPLTNSISVSQYFHSVFTRSSFQLPPISELKTLSIFISNINISEVDVYRVLRSLDVTKAMGCEGISPKLLKKCSCPSPTSSSSVLAKISSHGVAHSFNKTYV